LERLTRYDREDRLHFPERPDGQLRLKMYLDESVGVRIQNLWDDIPAVNSQAQERLGYPTQKPVALLERILKTSSNPGDLVLDPFCGCGTTIHAAQKLGRAWIGIDITHLAISLIERRLKDAFPGIAFEVHGTPKDLESAIDLARRDKYQFQWWAVSLVDARPYGGKKKGADGGIDGILFFRSDKDKNREGIDIGQGWRECRGRHGPRPHCRRRAREGGAGSADLVGASDQGDGARSGRRRVFRVALRERAQDPDHHSRRTLSWYSAPHPADRYRCDFQRRRTRKYWHSGCLL
jgi:DNA methylase